MSERLPYDWSISTIIELGNHHKDAVQTGPFGAQLHAEDYVEEGVPLILIKNIKDHGLDDADIPKITEEDANRLSRYRLNVGDIVFSRVGRVGSCFLTTEKEKGWVISGQTLRMRTDPAQVASKYLLYALRTEKLQRSLIGESVGSTRTSINTTILENLEVNVPPLPEQQKIAAILTSVDNVIESTQAQINKLHDLKTGMMQELLTQGIGHSEFKDSPVGRIPVGWEVVSLGELGKWKGGGTPSKSNPDFWAGSIPWASPKDMKSEFITRTADYISSEAVSNSSTNLVDSGSILLVTRSGILKHTLPVSIAGRELTINQDMKALRVSSDFCSHYVYHYLKAHNHKVLRACLKAGNTVESLDFGEFSKYRIPHPPLEEQKKISASVGAVAESIRSKQEQLYHYKNTKKALMQDLLTGKVRVTTD